MPVDINPEKDATGDVPGPSMAEGTGNIDEASQSNAVEGAPGVQASSTSPDDVLDLSTQPVNATDARKTPSSRVSKTPRTEDRVG
jgi:hypothetical protein